jgi:hypothetical protein
VRSVPGVSLQSASFTVIDTLSIVSASCHKKVKTNLSTKIKPLWPHESYACLNMPSLEERACFQEVFVIKPGRRLQMPDVGHADKGLLGRHSPDYR